jgi:hypothetical protein
MMQDLRALQIKRPSRIFWLIAVGALVSILLLLPRSPLPWLDEIFYASASLAIVRGGKAVPTIMGAFPHTLRLDLLYGPLISFLGSVDIRFLGLSATSWRLLGFSGAVGAVFSSAWVSRSLDRSPTAIAAAAMLVALSQGMGARATSGRLDTITITLELMSLASTLAAMRVEEPRRLPFVYAAFGGFFCGLAALSTPRAFPFVLGLFVALGFEFALARKQTLVTRGLIVGAGALLPVWGWTFVQGMNPITWLRFVATASRGDKINVSPMLEGSWHLFSGPLVPLLSGLLFVILMILVFGGASLTRAMEIEGRDTLSGVRLVSITVLVNYVALFVMIARFWDYEIFVIPLLIPVLTALTAKILRGSRRTGLRRAIFGSWLVLAVVLMAIRSGKVIAWVASYNERDPQPLQDFISRTVPAGSRVFGPEEFYFYAVEAAGSHYLFVRPRIPTGLISKLDHSLDWCEQLRAGPAVYLIWPKDETLPPGLSFVNLHLEGTFIAKLGKEPVGWRKAGWGSGYPSTNLYRITDAQ